MPVNSSQTRVVDKAKKIVVEIIDGYSLQRAMFPYLQSGEVKEAVIPSDFSQIAAGKMRRRENKKEIIIAVPMGVGTKDFSVGSKIYQTEKGQGKGTIFSLI
jgi:ornithine cyclodeaminase/alanine dehydrogenase-like protein (mu-crystallin family)